MPLAPQAETSVAATAATVVVTAAPVDSAAFVPSIVVPVAAAAFESSAFASIAFASIAVLWSSSSSRSCSCSRSSTLDTPFPPTSGGRAAVPGQAPIRARAGQGAVCRARVPRFLDPLHGPPSLVDLVACGPRRL